MTAVEKAHVFVADVDVPVLVATDRHHLEKVLRLRAGDAITVADGAGRWRTCRFGDPLERLGDVATEPAASPAITVAFALTKGERPEWAVQKLTELGVDRIVPFTAARSIVRWTGDGAAAHTERWRRVAREAASQCRRVWLPQIEDVQRFADVVRRPGVALAECSGRPPGLGDGAAGGTTIVVGPEGGWADEELALAAELGVSSIGLGEHVLRAETAAMTAGALLAALRSGLVLPAPISEGPKGAKPTKF